MHQHSVEMNCAGTDGFPIFIGGLIGVRVSAEYAAVGACTLRDQLGSSGARQVTKNTFCQELVHHTRCVSTTGELVDGKRDVWTGAAGQP